MRGVQGDPPPWEPRHVAPNGRYVQRGSASTWRSAARRPTVSEDLPPRDGSARRKVLPTWRIGRTLLVANRGEIAVRVFRACGELGIAHRRRRRAGRPGLAARALGRRDSRDLALSAPGGAHPGGEGSLTRTPSIPATAFSPRVPTSPRQSRQPGSPGSARRPRRSRPGGDKLEAKRIAREAGVPVVPEGGPDELGFPLLIKAAAGGGGRGMRVVRAPEELDEALAAARREAAAAFGDDRVFCERYVERPRHVEIQLLGDAHGNVDRARRARVLDPAAPPEGARGVAVACPRRRAARADERGGGRVRARDRLPQRRNRRVHARRARLLVPRVERPNPGRAPGHRARHRRRPRPGAAPYRAGRAHAGNGLALRGHAVEVRLYAEDPRSFLPQTGRIERLRLPTGIRVDAGVEEGDEIGTRYDPLIAKLIAHGADARGRPRPARGRARRDRGRRARHEPALPALARRASGAARGPDDDRVPVENPPLSAPPLACQSGRGAAASALNLPAPPPAPTAGRRAAAHDQAGGGGRAR